MMNSSCRDRAIKRHYDNNNTASLLMFNLTHEEESLLNERIAQGMILISLPTFFVLRYLVPSPWGKTMLSKRRQALLGPLLPPRLSWFIFESPNLVWSYTCWNERRQDLESVNQLLLSLFVLHYIQRDIVYPLILSKNTKPIPLVVVIVAFMYCNVNGYLQAQSLCQFHVLPDNWFYAPQFQFGLLCFFTGMFINIQSDAILRQLRQQSCSYQIPRGGSFEYVSAPHYFGEVLEWIGFFTACNFSNASLAFVIFTASNLIPRAIAHHKWYQTAFSGKYPPSRKAIIPFVW